MRLKFNIVFPELSDADRQQIGSILNGARAPTRSSNFWKWSYV